MLSPLHLYTFLSSCNNLPQFYASMTEFGSNFTALGASKYVEPAKIGYPEPTRADLKKDVYAVSRNGATRDLPERAPRRHGGGGGCARPSCSTDSRSRGSWW